MARDASHEVVPPADPRLRAALEVLAEALADAILRDLAEKAALQDQEDAA